MTKTNTLCAAFVAAVIASGCGSGATSPSGTLATYRAFAYLGGVRGTGPTTAINGLFLPGGRAQGQVSFQDFPGCGSAASVAWSATRR